MFAQYFGGAIFICVARTVFSTGLGSAMAQYAPGVDTQLVLNAGVTELRNILPAAELADVLLAYNQALVDVWVGIVSR